MFASVRSRPASYVLLVGSLLATVLLAWYALLTHVSGRTDTRGMGAARSAAVQARHEVESQQRRLGAVLSRGAGASAVGCPGPPFVAVEPVSAPPDAPLVLVTGGAGFIGSNTVTSLLSLGYSVRVLDNLSTGNASRLPAAHPRLELRVGDVKSAEDCAAAMAGGVTAVLHLAAFSRVAPSLQGGPASAAACQRDNVEGTLNVLEAARAAGVRRLLYAGSSTAYGGDAEAGEGDAGDDAGGGGGNGSEAVLLAHAYGTPLRAPLLPSWEGDRAAPHTPYAVSKHQGELLCAMYDATYGLRTVSLRLFMVYGLGEPREGAHATVAGRFVAAAAAGRPLPVEGDGRQTRDFVHVTDVARAFVLALQAPWLPRRAVINIGSAEATSVAELADMLSPGPHTHAPRRKQDMRHTLALICAARRLLGWAPRVALADGLDEMLAREREAARR